MSVPAAVKQVWNAIIQGNRFDKVLQKITLISAGSGVCKAEMTVCEEHTNSVGTLHGGMTATIVDVVSGVALSTHKNSPPIGVSVDIHVSFLKGVPLGEQIVIEAKTNRAGRRLAFLDVSISEKSSGSLIARGSHTKFIGGP